MNTSNNTASTASHCSNIAMISTHKKHCSFQIWNCWVQWIFDLFQSWFLPLCSFWAYVCKLVPKPKENPLVSISPPFSPLVCKSMEGLVPSETSLLPLSCSLNVKHANPKLFPKEITAPTSCRLNRTLPQETRPPKTKNPNQTYGTLTYEYECLFFNKRGSPLFIVLRSSCSGNWLAKGKFESCSN